MNKHILLDSIEADPYSLWAIHSSLADYQVAYLLNKYSKAKFKRHPKPIPWGTHSEGFERFRWEEPAKDIHVELFCNRLQIEDKKTTDAPSLFDQPQTKEVYLVTKLKNVDYFIVQYPTSSLPDFHQQLERLHPFEMMYAIDASEQPEELNLILD